MLQLWLLTAQAGGCWHCLAQHPPDSMATPHMPQTQQPCQMPRPLSEAELRNAIDWLWQILLSNDLWL